MSSSAASPQTLLQWTDAAYWRESRRPLTSLAFILPALGVYEIGVLLLGSRAMRNGADMWLRELLEQFGFGQYFLLPVLTATLLVAWHHTTRETWQVSAGVLIGMICECAVMGLLLVAVGRLQGALLHSLAGAPREHAMSLWSLRQWSIAGRMVGFLGAGIYEELLFRLGLVPIVAGLWQMVGGARRLKLFVAILITSFVFSGAHYLGPQGEHFDAHSFLFRFLAGGFFGALFVSRGFGIAAGSHALYDIFVGVF
jgi:Type II CAAX prenyl endopeptidase Rce1-like